jgi:predicted PurR-regulated permease PerM
MADIDPRDVIRQWGPHVLMFLLVALAVVLVGNVLRPILSTVLIAAALAFLTGPILYEPLKRVAEKLLPKASESVHRKAAGIGATLVLVAIVLLPFVLLLVSTLGSLGGVVEVAVGIATDDPEQLQRVERLLAGQIAQLDQMYPQLGLEGFDLPAKATGLLKEARGVGPAMLDYLFRGAGLFAQAALALVSLAFFVAEGPRLVRAMLKLSPLDRDQEQALVAGYHDTVRRLLTDTVGTALVKGFTLAGIAWAVAAIAGPGRLPYLPVAFLAAFLVLLPLVGETIVWLPLAVILWKTVHPVAAIVLAVVSLAAIFVIDSLRQRFVSRWDDRGSWLSFLMFLSLVGGVIGFGLAGLVIGPVSVVLLVTLVNHWLPIYVPAKPDS